MTVVTGGSVDRRSARIGIALYAAWLAAAVILGLWRPGELLEVAAVGAAGLVAFTAVARSSPTAQVWVVAGACFAAPLLATWPVRTYEAHQLPALPGALASVGSIAPLLALVAALSGGARTLRVPRAVAAAAALLLAGVVASSGTAIDHSSALAAGWLEYGAPMCLALAVVTASRTTADVRLFLIVLVAAALPPLVIAIASYVVDFGIPHGAADLVSAKAELYRPHLLQQQTFGNVQHLADFSLALLVPATALAGSRRVPPALRAAATATAVAALIVLVLVLNRSAIVVAGAVLLLAVAAAVRRGRLRDLALPAAMVAALLAVSLAPSVRRSYERILPVKTTTSASAGSSVETRLSAGRTGWAVARSHLPFGVGTDQYPRYDPVHQAPHSLALKALSENGLLGALGWLLLAGYVCVRTLGTAVRGRHEHRRLTLAAGAGALAIITHGVIAGVDLSFGHANVWALVLWIQIGSLTALERTGGVR